MRSDSLEHGAADGVSPIDRALYRYPFEGRSARIYGQCERAGFGDLDERLLARWRPALAGARCVLDLGAGTGTLCRALRRALPGVMVLGLEPSEAMGRLAGPDRAPWLRARGEALPLATGSIDVAVSISAIRHVRDRRATLAELRRVVRPGGVAFLVELDPRASRARLRRHTRGMSSRLSRLTFGPLVLRTAPSAEAIAAAACDAGWRSCVRTDDPLQPVYVLRLE